jgi:hypothetical protein
MFPELPDARMDTRKPIAFPQYSPNKYSAKQIFRIIAERPPRVNAETQLHIFFAIWWDDFCSAKARLRRQP